MSSYDPKHEETEKLVHRDPEGVNTPAPAEEVPAEETVDPVAADEGGVEDGEEAESNRA